MTMYDLLKLTKTKLPYAIRHEMDGVTANDKTIDLRQMTWRKIEDLITTAWGTASRRPEGYHDRINSAPNEAAPNLPAAQIHHGTETGLTMHPVIPAATTQTARSRARAAQVQLIRATRALSLRRVGLA